MQNGSLEYRKGQGSRWSEFPYFLLPPSETNMKSVPAVYHDSIRAQLLAESPEGAYGKLLVRSRLGTESNEF